MTNSTYNVSKEEQGEPEEEEEKFNPDHWDNSAQTLRRLV